jgi:hypothetical protein
MAPSGSQITDLEGYRKVPLFFVNIHTLEFQFVGLEGFCGNTALITGQFG